MGLVLGQGLRPGAVLGLLLLLGVWKAGAEQGLLRAVSNLNSALVKEYCIIYNDEWLPFPKSLDNATAYPLQNLTSTTLCDSADVPPGGIMGKLVVVLRGNCTFIRKAQIAQKHFAKALLIASLDGLSPPSGNKSDTEKLNIPVALIDYRDILMMRKILGENISGALYSPPVPVLDYSILIIFIVAVATVAFGSYWSGMDEGESGHSILSDSRRQTNSEDKTKDSSAVLTPLTVVVFVVICSVMIVLLYFFYKWLVYMVIGIFALAAAVSVYNCLAALIKRIPYWKCKVPYVQRRIEVRLVMLALFCVTMASIWVAFRNADRWIWTLHDCLGVAFCLNFMKTLKMPHFKSCVILLVLLLIYDVFFVFITPYFTKNHESIMVEVAAGSGSTTGEKRTGNYLMGLTEPVAHSEKLPVVIRVPRLMPSVATLCGTPFSILGFGDIIVPGLLVAYCRRFDLQTNTSNIYFILCTTAYAVGMVLTFIVLIVTKMAQPALLYLVPCTLLTCVVTAWIRKEVKIFWAGSDYEVLDVTNEALLQDDEPSWYSG
ncbi:signal peptide peptidase-like 2A isoform X2 [Hemiscyllium ocellatum]|uniref:signal peptide peptidase-like 2A isoform X2 n=1 Tax=Hemiscyllium ocellatum TaxID=170820 RepID=UPI002966F47E|nr:signal peptide peptidase-like 2A isoform X2 [Hemiscyllium ocellatum]